MSFSQDTLVGHTDMFTVVAQDATGYGQGIKVKTRISQGSLGENHVFAKLEFQMNAESAEQFANLLLQAVKVYRKKERDYADDFNRDLVE